MVLGAARGHPVVDGKVKFVEFISAMRARPVVRFESVEG